MVPVCNQLIIFMDYKLHTATKSLILRQQLNTLLDWQSLTWPNIRSDCQNYRNLALITDHLNQNLSEAVSGDLHFLRFHRILICNQSMTDYHMTNPDCGYCEKRELDVDCSARMEKKHELGCEGGEIWIGRERREHISGQGDRKGEICSRDWMFLSRGVIYRNSDIRMKIQWPMQRMNRTGMRQTIRGRVPEPCHTLQEYFCP